MYEVFELKNCTNVTKSLTEVLREKLGSLIASQLEAYELGMATGGRKTDPLTKKNPKE